MYRVLLIDDQPIFRDIIRGMLDKAGGFEVVAEREDGAQAADTYQDVLPDAVIMDVQMPQMNGFEAAGTILGTDPKAVVVLTSMKQDDEYEQLASEAGAAAFYPKRHLNVEVVRDLIEQRHLEVLAA
ncbi:MAG: response regulator transcription factor [Chloroflexi bacterium]|jgi:two-component system, chemotaxis family, chemotaxis protein CheY|nr:response regulator transcription factor [Chloroflexota bacterium]